MKSKKTKQVTIGVVSAVTLFSSVMPGIANADVFFRGNISELPSKHKKNIDEVIDYISSVYSDVDINDTGLNSIGDTSKSEVYTLTKEDEKRINEAVNDYLEMYGYNNSVRLYGIGKNWWNSRDFIGGVINVALVAIGIGAGIRSANVISQLIRANRRNITRVVEKEILKRVGINGSAFVGAALDIAGAMTGISVGGAIGYGLDKADGKLDGYFMA